MRWVRPLPPSRARPSPGLVRAVGCGLTHSKLGFQSGAGENCQFGRVLSRRAGLVPAGARPRGRRDLASVRKVWSVVRGAGAPRRPSDRSCQRGSAAGGSAGSLPPDLRHEKRNWGGIHRGGGHPSGRSRASSAREEAPGGPVGPPPSMHPAAWAVHRNVRLWGEYHPQMRRPGQQGAPFYLGGWGFP